MHVDNNPDFKSVWQLAHDWAGEKIDQTDPDAISPKLRLYIDRLIRAIGSTEISGRWKGHRIFIDESFLTFVFDLRHFIRFYIWVMFNKFSKDYLDNLYVKRNEVIIWCDKIALIDPPPCWSHKNLAAIDHVNSESADPDEDNNSWYDKITERRRQRVVCIELAKQLWESNPNLSYEEMQKHSIMRQFGYSSTFSSKSFRKLVRDVASEPAQFFADQGMGVIRILTDHGTEYCGKPENHDYQLYLALNDIEHSRTKANHPQINGICERFHKTILQEFYQVAFRRKIYHSIEELQTDLDDWMTYYNIARTHQGKMYYGRTPMQTLIDAK